MQRFDGQARGLPFSAHPRLAPDGTIWNFGYASAARRLFFWQLDRSGSLRKVRFLNVRRPACLMTSSSPSGISFCCCRRSISISSPARPRRRSSMLSPLAPGSSDEGARGETRGPADPLLDRIAGSVGLSLRQWLGRRRRHHPLRCGERTRSFRDVRRLSHHHGRRKCHAGRAGCASSSVPNRYADAARRADCPRRSECRVSRD